MSRLGVRYLEVPWMVHWEGFQGCFFSYLLWFERNLVWFDPLDVHEYHGIYIRSNSHSSASYACTNNIKRQLLPDESIVANGWSTPMQGILVPSTLVHEHAHPCRVEGWVLPNKESECFVNNDNFACSYTYTLSLDP